MSVAIYFVEERVFKMGSQENESATEKTIDNRIESAILSGYKSVSGKCFPIADSDLRPGSQAKYKNMEFIATERKWLHPKHFEKQFTWRIYSIHKASTNRNIPAA